MKRSAVGLILVLIGSVFLLRNLGWIPNITHYVFSWPNFLFLFAIGFLISGKPRPAFVFLLIGGYFWMQRYFDFDMSMFWPVVLIVIGIAFLLRQNSSSRNTTEKANSLDETNIFSGSKKAYSSPAFEGGKITTLFGGTQLDFREAVPAEGATLDLFVMFGGAELRIPANWNVVTDATPVFGGVSDERDKGVTKDGPTIRIKGTVVFGGVEIKN